MERKDKLGEARQDNNRLLKTVSSKAKFAVVLIVLAALCIAVIMQWNIADNKIEKGNDLLVDSSIPDVNWGWFL